MSQRTASRSTRIAVCSAGAAALAIAACTFSVPAKTAQTAGGLVMLQVTPAGTFKPNDGRELKPGAWRIDAASAQHVIERFKTRGKPPVIDYEHCKGCMICAQLCPLRAIGRTKEVRAW